jgi:hypothetical protein
MDDASSVTVSFIDRFGASLGAPADAAIVDGLEGIVSFAVPEDLGSPSPDPVNARDGVETGVSWPITRSSTPTYFYVTVTWPDSQSLRVPTSGADSLMWVTGQPDG